MQADGLVVGRGQHGAGLGVHRHPARAKQLLQDHALPERRRLHTAQTEQGGWRVSGRRWRSCLDGRGCCKEVREWCSPCAAAWCRSCRTDMGRRRWQAAETPPPNGLPQHNKHKPGGSRPSTWTTASDLRGNAFQHSGCVRTLPAGVVQGGEHVGVPAVHVVAVLHQQLHRLHVTCTRRDAQMDMSA